MDRRLTAVILGAIIGTLIAMLISGIALYIVTKPGGESGDPNATVDISPDFELVEIGGSSRVWHFSASKHSNFSFNESSRILARLDLAPVPAERSALPWAGVDSAALQNATVCVDLLAPGFDETVSPRETCSRSLPTIETPAMWVWLIAPEGNTYGERALSWSLSILPNSGPNSTSSSVHDPSRPIFSINSKVVVDKGWWLRQPELVSTLIGGFSGAGAVLGAILTFVASLIVRKQSGAGGAP